MTYREIRERADAIWQAYSRPPRPRIDVTIATSSHAAGAGRTLAAVHRAIEEQSLDADIGVLSSGGMDFLEPVVVITQTDGRRVMYGPVTPEHVAPLVAETVARPGVHEALAVATIAGEGGPPPLAEHFFMKGQVRWLMQNVGITNPEVLDHYIARGGYEGLARVVTMTPEEIIKETVDSGVWGRGGAG